MLARFIRSREQARWRAETRRRILPFAWGIEHLGGAANPAERGGACAEPGAFLARYAEEALAASERFFTVSPAEWYHRDGEVLTFPSAIPSAFPENNIVYARVFEASKRRRRSEGAVIVLPQWNADWEGHANICRALQRFGLTAVRLSLPYHDRRMPPGLERADYMVSPNIGLTLEASRQAVVDARRLVVWLRDAEGYRKLGILGTSIGSSVAFITLAHEPALRAAVLLHVSTYVADVVRTGLTTSHVWEGLKGHVSADELRHYWAPISPYPYVGKLAPPSAGLAGAGKQVLVVSGRYDTSFLPEFSQQLWEDFDRRQIPYELLVLPCGHYTLGTFPFSYWAGVRFIPFLRRALA
ncbi:MAG: RcgR family putative quorum lactone hydrolase [Terriglobia bacterium]